MFAWWIHIVTSDRTNFRRTSGTEANLEISKPGRFSLMFQDHDNSCNCWYIIQTAGSVLNSRCENYFIISQDHLGVSEYIKYPIQRCLTAFFVWYLGGQNFPLGMWSFRISAPPPAMNREQNWLRMYALGVATTPPSECRNRTWFRKWNMRVHQICTSICKNRLNVELFANSREFSHVLESKTPDEQQSLDDRC